MEASRGLYPKKSVKSSPSSEIKFFVASSLFMYILFFAKSSASMYF